LSGAADGYAARGTALKLVIAGFFPLTGTLGESKTEKSRYKDYEKQFFHHIQG
jgi:hypothetical protein